MLTFSKELFSFLIPALNYWLILFVVSFLNSAILKRSFYTAESTGTTTNRYIYSEACCQTWLSGQKKILLFNKICFRNQRLYWLKVKHWSWKHKGAEKLNPVRCFHVQNAPPPLFQHKNVLYVWLPIARAQRMQPHQCPFPAEAPRELLCYLFGAEIIFVIWRTRALIIRNYFVQKQNALCVDAPAYKWIMPQLYCKSVPHKQTPNLSLEAFLKIHTGEEQQVNPVSLITARQSCYADFQTVTDIIFSASRSDSQSLSLLIPDPFVWTEEGAHRLSVLRVRVETEHRKTFICLRYSKAPLPLLSAMYKSADKSRWNAWEHMIAMIRTTWTYFHCESGSYSHP